MTVLRGAAWACALVAGGLVIGGCTPDEPEPTPTTPVETSTSAPETSEPTVAAPEMPAEAAEPTAAGAEAFVRYWFDLANHAVATGQSDALAQISSPECVVCSSVLTNVDDTYGNGGRIEGNVFSVTSVAAPPVQNNASLTSVQFEQSAGVQVDADGTETAIAAVPSQGAGAVVTYANGQWTMFGIGE